METETRQRLSMLEARLDALAEGEGLALGAEGFRVGSTRLFEKLASGEYHLHQRDGEGVESDLTGAKSIRGVPVSETAPTAAQVLVYDAALDEYVPSAPTAPGAHVLATTAGLGPSHTTSGLTSGQVLQATGAATAAFRPASEHGQHGGGMAQHANEYHDPDMVSTIGNQAVAGVKTFSDGIKADTIDEETAAAGVTIDLLTLLKDGKITPHTTYPDSFFQVTSAHAILGLDADDYFAFTKSSNLWALFLAAAWRFRMSPTAADFNVPLDMNAHKIEKVTDPTADQDAATKKYVDDLTAVKPMSLIDFGTEINGQAFTP